MDKLLQLDPGNVELAAQKQEMLGEKAKTAAKKLDALKAAQEEVNRAFEAGEIDDGQYREFTRQVERASIELKQCEDAAAGVNKEAASETPQKYGTKMQSLGTAATAAAAGIAAAVVVMREVIQFGQRAVAVVGELVDAFGEFETGMAKVSTLDLSMSENEISAISEDVLELSKTMGILPTETAEATYQMASAMGKLEGDVAGYVGVAAQAAKGGFTDITTAVDGLSTVMNAFGATSEADMQRFSDQMLVAQNLGKTTFGDLASSIGKVAPIAAMLKVSTDELFASFAVLTKNGLATAESTTALKAAFSNILKPTAEASKLAESLGVDFSAAALEAQGLAGFLENVTEATDGSSEALATLFGSTEALNAIAILTSEEGAPALRDAIAAMGDAAGATEAAYDRMADTIEGRKARFEATLAVSKIDLGEQFAPLAEAAYDAVEGIITAFDNPEMQSSIGDLTTSLSGLIDTLGETTVDKLPGFIDGLNVAIDKGLPFAGKLADLASFFRTVGGGWIVGSASAIFGTAKEWDGLQLSAGPVLTMFGDLISKMGLTTQAAGSYDTVGASLGIVIDAAKRAGDATGEFNNFLGGPLGLQPTIATTAEAAEEAADGMDAFADAAQDAGESASAAKIGVYDISAALDATGQSAQDAASAYGVLANKATDALNRLKSDTSTSLLDMMDTLRYNQDAVSSWGDNLVQLSQRAGELGAEGFYDYWVNLGPEYAAQLQQLLDSGDRVFSDMAALATDAGGSAGSAYLASIQALPSQTDAALWEMLQSSQATADELSALWAGSATQGIYEYIKTLGYAPDEAQDIVLRLVKSTEAGMDDMAAAMVSGSDAAAQAVLANLGMLEGAASGIGASVGAGLASGIESMIGSVSSASARLAKEAELAMLSTMQIQSPSHVTQRIGQLFGAGLVVGMGDTISDVRDAAHGLATAAAGAAAVSPLDFSVIGGAAAQGSGSRLTVNVYTREMTKSQTDYLINRIDAKLGARL